MTVTEMQHFGCSEFHSGDHLVGSADDSYRDQVFAMLEFCDL